MALRDDFIAGYAKIVKGKSPHIPVEWPKEIILSGLEQFRLSPEITFVNGRGNDVMLLEVENFCD